MPLEGWLWKQGVKGIVKGWKNRWFAMPNDFELHYYQSNTALESLGYIDIRIVSSVVADPSKKKDAKGFLFYINTPARVYNLAANTEKELNYWVDGLNAILPDKKRTMSVNLTQLQVESNDKVLMTQLLKEKDAKFDVLSKEAAKQRLKLESCERELSMKEEKLASLTDQVQNLTSLVAHEKQSNDAGSEEAARQKAKLQQMVDMIEAERSTAQAANSKLSALETSNATLRAQNDTLTQANSKMDAEITRAREDALAKVRDADARVAAIKGENELLNQSVLHLQATLKEGSNRDSRQLSQMDKSNTDLQHTIATLEQLLKERGDEVRALQEKWDSSQQTIKEVWDQITEANRIKDETVREKDVEVEEWKAKHAAARGDIEQLNEQMANTHKALEELTVKWADTAKELEDKKNEVEVWSETCMKAQQYLEAKTSEMEQAAETWMATMKEKEEEKEGWKSKWEQAQAEMSQKSGEEDHSRKLAEEAKAWQMKLDEKTKELEKTSEAWMTALKEKDVEKEGWKTKYDTATEQMKELEKAVEVWMTTIQEKEAEIAGWKSKWEQSQEEIAQKSDEGEYNRRLEEEAKAWQAKLDSATSELAEWQKKWEAAQAEEKKWKSKQEEIQQKYDALLSQQDEAKEEWNESAASKSKELVEWTAKWDDVQITLEAKEDEIAGLQKRVEDWRGRWEEADTKLKHIEADTKHQLDEWKHKVEKLQSGSGEAVKKLETELNELKQKLSDEAQAWQLKLDTTQVELEGKAKEVEEWKQKEEELRKELEEWKQKEEESRRAVEELRIEAQDKEAARQADSELRGSEAATQLEAKEREWKQQAGELDQERNRERDELKQQLTDAETRVAAKDDEVKDLQAKLDEWNAKANDMGKEADGKEAEVKALQARVSELESQSAELQQNLNNAMQDAAKEELQKEVEEWKAKWDAKVAEVETQTQDWSQKLSAAEHASREWEEKAQRAEERAATETAELQQQLGDANKAMNGPTQEGEELRQKLSEKEKEVDGLHARIAEVEQELTDKEAKVKAWEVKYIDEKDKMANMEEMYNYLKEKADQVEEWKQKWVTIEKSLIERVREDDELRLRLESLQHDLDAKVAEAEHFKTKWWEGKEKVDEAQRVAREREEESEKWRLRWEELNSDVKVQESSISEMGKEWDVIHKELTNELAEWKDSAKAREDALTAVSVFLEQLTTHEEPTENGIHPDEAEKEGGKEISITSLKRRKLSLPTKALQGKYEPLSQRGIVLYHMLEEKRQLENDNRALNREVRALKGEEPLSLSTEMAQSEAKRKEELRLLTAELEDMRKSESELRDALRSSEDNLRQTTTLFREETEQLKSELAAERQRASTSPTTRADDAEATADALSMLALAQEQASEISAHVSAMLRETQANEAANQVLKDAEEAIGVLHAKVQFLARELESQRTVAASEVETRTAGGQAQVEMAQLKIAQHETTIRVLQERLDAIAEQDTSINENSQKLQKRVLELEDELRAKEDDFKILRQVRQGEMLLKEEELRKKDTELQELRERANSVQWLDPASLSNSNGVAGARGGLSIGSSREMPQSFVLGGARDRSHTDISQRPPLQHSMSALDLIQRSPRSMAFANTDQALKAKVDELVAEVKSKKEELRSKEDELAAHELEIQELKMKISDIEMEAKQREIELEHEAQMKIAELEHELQMRVTELEQVVRTKDIELQIKDVELQTISNQVVVAETTNEIMRAEADVVEEAVTRVQEETVQREEEVNDLYTRLEMAEQVVRDAQNSVAQKEEEVHELQKKIEVLEGWLREKDNELDHSQNEKQKNKQIMGEEIEKLEQAMQEKLALIDSLNRKVLAMQDSLNVNTKEVLDQKTAADIINLQKKISQLNAENAVKDDMIANMKKEKDRRGRGNSNSDQMNLVRQLENEKEARLAQQQHITFLCQELDRIELESKTKDIKLQTLVERASLLESSSEEVSAEVKKYKLQLDNLKENYFLSVGRSVKLQGTLVGWYANISLNELYEEAVATAIPLEEWPSWITKKFQENNQKFASPKVSSKA